MKIPSMLFNNTDYQYPKGFKVLTVEEKKEKLRNGWWEGPCSGKPPWETIKENRLSVKGSGKKYQCPECDFETNYNHVLKGHMTRYHKD